ncbi:hypothetical protein ACHAW5_005628 [Stephanodiscus triporus]|uniref:MYND-type domain-containing protein n=1 Tax=Stephanodiscus triporus TaxID=2934178 RepID=A0ABD3MTF6_9STRA
MMMSMQPGAVPPGMMPHPAYPMPQYYNVGRGNPRDESCELADIQSGGGGKSCGGGDCSIASDNSTMSVIFNEACEVFTRSVLHTFDLIGRGSIFIIDYAEREFCAPAIKKLNSHAELMENVDRLNKFLIKEKEKTSSPNVSDKTRASCKSDTGRSCRTGLISADSDNVQQSSSSFFKNLFSKDPQTKNALRKKTHDTITVDVDKDSKTKQKKHMFSRSQSVERLRKFLPLKSSQPKYDAVKNLENLNESTISQQSCTIDITACDANAKSKPEESDSIVNESIPMFSDNLFIIDQSFEASSTHDFEIIHKEPNIDYVNLTEISSPSEKTHKTLSRKLDFSEGVREVLSPVSVIQSLETPSCAWCGLGGSDAKAVEKLKLCSSCQSTYYCSTECQSNDWVNGHATKCQVAANAD